MLGLKLNHVKKRGHWASNYIQQKIAACDYLFMLYICNILRDVIIHPFRNFNCDFIKPPMKLSMDELSDSPFLILSLV